MLPHSLQLLSGGGLGQAAVQQGPGERACNGSAGGGGRPLLERTLEDQPSEFGDEFLEEQPSSASLESLPADFRLLAAISGSPGHGGGLQTAAGDGSSSPSAHALHFRRRGGSAASLAGSMGSDGSVSECTIVVHNLAAYLSAREIGEFFMQ